MGAGAFLAGLPAVGSLFSAPARGAGLERSLSFHNLHTEERLTRVYWREGQYLTHACAEIDHLLRDHRNNEVMEMDRRLFDLLSDLDSSLGGGRIFQVISGYRSPATNEMLRRQGGGVSERSYHLKGMAIDIRVPEYPLNRLHSAALDLGAGGVGYYPNSNFVHVDVGPVRSW